MSTPPSLPPKPSQSQVPILPPKSVSNQQQQPHTQPSSPSNKSSPALPKKPTFNQQPQTARSPKSSNLSLPTPLLPPKRFPSNNQQSISASSGNSTPPPPPKSQLNHHLKSPAPPEPKPRFPFPQSFNLLPNSELAKLTKSLDILRGFIYTQIESEKEGDITKINQILAKIESFKVNLEQINKKKAETNTLLEDLQKEVEQWEAVQLEMYSSLSKFSRDHIYQLLTTAVNDAKQLSESIQTSFISYPGVHDDESIQDFVNQFMKERTSYYLRREKLARFNEGRIGGLQ